MENKKNNKLYIIIGILIVLIVLALTYIIYDKVINKPQPKEEPQINNTNNSVNNENISIDNIVIKNEEVKELYDKYFKVDYNGEGSFIGPDDCLGVYYNKSFKNHDLEDKIELTLRRYAYKNMKKIDKNFIQKLTQKEKENLRYLNSEEWPEFNIIDYSYISFDEVKKGMKLLFNIDLNDFNENNYDKCKNNIGCMRSYEYIKSSNAFVPVQGGGELWSTTYQQIIGYNELNDEINFTVVGAYMETPIEFIGTDDWETMYVYDKDEKIYSKDSKSFKFTKNIDKLNN